MMQIIDAWNNVPHAPGSRTVGSRRALRDFRSDVEGRVTSGRDRTARADDLTLLGGARIPAVPTTTPRSMPCRTSTGWSRFRHGASRTRHRTTCPSRRRGRQDAVPKQVLALSPEDFFNRLNRLLVTNPPEPDDPKSMARLAKLGIAPGATFRMDAFTPEARKAIEAGVADVKRCARRARQGGQRLEYCARHGALRHQYTYRAGWTFFGVGGNLPEDAVYPFAESTAMAPSTARTYTLHFTKAEIPPSTRSSMTMYDADAYLVANPINRYALGDRSHLTFDTDGGLTLFIQSDSPGKDKESNWLPAPKDAGFKLALRSTRQRRKSRTARGRHRL